MSKIVSAGTGVAYSLAHPDQAELVRRAGHRRTLAEHTYHARFQKLFAELRLDQ